MKREEALDAIKQILWNQNLIEYAEAYEHAEEILTKLEQLGIGPKPKYISNGCLCSMREQCYCGPGTYVFGWDKT